MAAQGDHVDCAALLLHHGAPIDDVTVVSNRIMSYLFTSIRLVEVVVVRCALDPV